MPPVTMRSRSSVVLQCLAVAACGSWCVDGLRQRPWRMVDVVAVAEKLQPDWAASVIDRMPDSRLRLYCTGDLPVDAPCVQTERVGSEEYAFLKHIVDNYDMLAEVTIFTPFDIAARSDKQERLESLVQLLDNPFKQDMFRSLVGFKSEPFQYFPVQPVWDGQGRKEVCGPTVRPFGAWYRRFINTTDLGWKRINCTAAALGNVFAVRADRIRRVPLSVYEGLMREVEHCRGHSSNLIGYYMERSWAALFADRCHRAQAYQNLATPPQSPPLQLRAKPAAVKAAQNIPVLPQQQHHQAEAKPVVAQAAQNIPVPLQQQQQQQQHQVTAKPVVAQAPKPTRSIDLVVASYSAPLDWIEPQLAKLPGARLHLYCKGGSTDPRCIQVENVGTEEYAFFTHILRHWNDLADITIFSKDNMADTETYHPTALECLNYITNNLSDTTSRNAFQGYMSRLWFPVTEHFELFKYHASSHGKVKNLCRPSVSPFGPWYLRFINPDDTNYEHMHCTAASMHGIFAVSRDRIRRLPRSRFVDLIEEVETCRGYNAFTAGHYMERSWAPLFAERCHDEEARRTMAGTDQIGLQQFYDKFKKAKVE
mmetsp:Transcript_9913/g.30615  ORF Transcript_9913/g.30615 Transcript_9913/m.30615 type:complete len:593 (+) Transcript_9913:41-1819(+)